MSMISNVSIDKKCESILLDYLSTKHKYNGESLIYSTKYTSGTFTVSSPSNSFINCIYINGYPHFTIPLEITLGEIYDFLEDRPLYTNNYFIRYGDTHPHKIIPKLGQIRDLLLCEAFSSMITTSGSKQCFYTIGDISYKTISSIINNQFSATDTIPDTQPLIDYIFKQQHTESELIHLWKEYVLNSEKVLLSFLNDYKFNINKFILESSIYSNSDLYDHIAKKIICENGIREDGCPKYILQEIAFILNFKNDNQTMINIICSKQIDHVLNVTNTLKINNIDDDVRYLVYGECKNAESRDAKEWINHLNKFIDNNGLVIGNNLLDYKEFLKIVFYSISNQSIVDFSSLEKYKRNYLIFKSIKESLYLNKDNKIEVKSSNNLLNKMALVNYQLNNSIISGEQFRFFNYIASIKDEYCKNYGQYRGLDELYRRFMLKCLERLSIN